MHVTHDTPRPDEPAADTGFYGLNIAPKILEILESINFKTPTPIQRKSIPLAIQGADIIGIAQTGTGKTHAFGIPLIQVLSHTPGVGFVLAPTRELALQIHEQFQPLLKAYGFRSACLIGGAPMTDQRLALRQNPRVVIATPGRLIDHISQWNVFPEEAAVLVLDEADRMLDMGFIPQVEKIISAMPKQRQTLLFSATMPKEIVDIVAKYMKLPVRAEVAPPGTTAELVSQELFIVQREEKPALLLKLLAAYHGSVLLFCRTKHGAGKVSRTLRRKGVPAAEIHSDRSLPQRRDALEGFKRGRYRVLVATDIASRGIDVSGIELVINYDLPEDPENYVHRIGRTGRAGATGHAISLSTPEQKRDVENIERLIQSSLPRSVHPGVPQASFNESDAAAVRRTHGPDRSQKRRRPRSGSSSRRRRSSGSGASRPAGEISGAA